MPIPSSADRAIAAAQDLTKALANPSPASPLAPIADTNRQALQQLSDIFADAAMPPPLTHPPPGPPIARPVPPIPILRPPPGYPALPSHPLMTQLPPELLQEDDPVDTTTLATLTPTEPLGVDPAFDPRVAEDQSPSSPPVATVTPSIAAQVPRVVLSLTQPGTYNQAT